MKYSKEKAESELNDMNRREGKRKREIEKNNNS